MKKLFTLAAAVLASLAINAQTTIFEWGDMSQSTQPDPTVGTLENVGSLDGYNSVKINSNSTTVYGLKCNANILNSGVATKYYKITPVAAAGGFEAGDTVIYSHVYNNSAAKTTNISIVTITDNKIIFDGTQTANGRLVDGVTIDTCILGVDAASLAIGRNGSTSTFILSIKVVRPAPAPTILVSKETLDLKIGRSGLAQKKDSFILTGKNLTPSDATEFNFPAHAGLSVDPANFTIGSDGKISQKFIVTYAPTAEEDNFNGNITIKVGASLSKSVALECNKLAPQADLVVVDDDITWNFDGVLAASIQPADINALTIFANVSDDWAAGFAADKLAGIGQYFYYKDNKCFQGSTLKFKVASAGKISVVFSNTGGGTRPYRHLFVNGTDTGKKSNNTDKVTASDIAVSAGDVLLEGMIEEDPMTLNMLRIYSVSFTKGGGTAIDNTEAEVKTVKMFENGQLIIIKNGVKYNAQGAVVR